MAAMKGCSKASTRRESDVTEPRPRPFTEPNVREHPLPGNRRLREMTLPDGTSLTVATEPDKGELDLSITAPGKDEAMASVRMSEVEATTLAALLSGIRLTPPSAAAAADAGDVDDAGDVTDLRTMRLPVGAPAVGRRLDELEVPAPDQARVIAVIRDDTPQLIEEDPDRPCRPGDRLVLVGRPAAMGDLVSALTGAR